MIDRRPEIASSHDDDCYGYMVRGVFFAQQNNVLLNYHQPRKKQIKTSTTNHPPTYLSLQKCAINFFPAKMNKKISVMIKTLSSSTSLLFPCRMSL